MNSISTFKSILLLFIFLIISCITQAQTGQWTWMGGNDNITTPCNPGYLGVEVPSNEPGGRSGSLSWTDSKGNFWLMGGY